MGMTPPPVHGQVPELITIDSDDPLVVEQQQVEEYTNHVVPPTARLSREMVLGGWSSIASAMAFVFYGALSASMVGVQQAIVGLVAVAVFYGLIAGIAARRAVQSGLTPTLLSRELFGSKGAALGPLLIAAAAIYYAVFEGSIMALALQAYFGVWDIRVWYVIVVASMVPLMLGGMQSSLSKLNGASLPIYFFGLIAAVLVAGTRFGWSGDYSHFDAPANPLGIPGWVTVFVLYMGVWIMFPDTQDAARWGRPSDLRFHRHVTFGWAYYAVAYVFNGLVGILIVALTASETGIGSSEFGVVQGVVASLGVLGLGVILVSQLRINSANFYFASINLERCVAHFSRVNLNRRSWVLVIAGVVLSLMFTDVFTYIAKALAWQGVLVVSWVAMMIVSWVFDRDRAVEFRTRRVKVVAPGFFVWVGVSAVGIALIQMPAQFPTLSALAPLVSFLLALLIFSVVRLAGASGLREFSPDHVREVLADPWAVRVQCTSCRLHYVGIEMDSTAHGDVLCLDCQ